MYSLWFELELERGRWSTKHSFPDRDPSGSIVAQKKSISHNGNGVPAVTDWGLWPQLSVSIVPVHDLQLLNHRHGWAVQTQEKGTLPRHCSASLSDNFTNHWNTRLVRNILLKLSTVEFVICSWILPFLSLFHFYPSTFSSLSHTHIQRHNNMHPTEQKVGTKENIKR